MTFFSVAHRTKTQTNHQASPVILGDSPLLVTFRACNYWWWTVWHGQVTWVTVKWLLVKMCSDMSPSHHLLLELTENQDQQTWQLGTFYNIPLTGDQQAHIQSIPTGNQAHIHPLTSLWMIDAEAQRRSDSPSVSVRVLMVVLRIVLMPNDSSNGLMVVLSSVGELQWQEGQWREE